MHKILTYMPRVTAIAVLVGSFAFTSPLSAVAADTSDPAMAKTQEHGGKTDHSAEAMAKRVENRIKTLHDKLGVTSVQEAKWGDVAQTMRDNEATVNQLVQARHQDPANMTAVDDLQSYEKIAQAHVDGLEKLIPAFQALYSDMSDDQKKDADHVFGSFEGHRADMSAKKHS